MQIFISQNKNSKSSKKLFKKHNELKYLNKIKLNDKLYIIIYIKLLIHASIIYQFI